MNYFKRMCGLQELRLTVGGRTFLITFVLTTLTQRVQGLLSLEMPNLYRDVYDECRCCYMRGAL